jgi:hypothetical protein
LAVIAQGRRLVALAAVLATGLIWLVSAPASPAAAKGGRVAKVERLERHLRNDLKGILAQARAQLIQLAQLPSVQSGDSSACNADMKARGGDPRYASIGAADISGNLYCLSIPFTPPLSVADRAYFLRAIGTGGFAVGDFQIGRVTGQGAVGLGFPVVSGGRATGIVLATLALAWYDPRVEAQLRRPARDLLVIDDHGTVLAHAGPTAVSQGTNLGGTALVKKALKLDHSEGTTRFGGKRVFAAIDVVPLSGEAIHVAVTAKP